MPEVQLRKDALWGKRCLGYSVQAFPDHESLARIGVLQDRALGLCPMDLRRTPLGTIHVSVFPVLPARSFVTGKAQLWERLRTDVVEVIAPHGPADQVTLRFEQIYVTETALILSTPDQPRPI